MAEGNSSGWMGQLIGAVVLALVAGGSSPWWWTELKRTWQPDAPAPATSASVAQPASPAAIAASATASGVAAETSAAAPRPEPAAIRPRPEVTGQTSQQPAAVRPAARATPATAPVAPASSGQPTTREPNPEAYRAVQLIYEATKGVSECAALAASVKNLQRYTRGPRPVPDQFRQTVIYPKRLVQPTIGDLAIDRIARVKLAAPKCFP
jgi:hypothetical protein